MKDIIKGFKDGDFVVNCKTEKQAQEFVKICYDNGIKWFYDKGFGVTYWVDSTACYRCRENNYLVHGRIIDYLEKFVIFDFDDFMDGYKAMKKFTKNDLKVGMLVEFRNGWKRIVMNETMGDLYLMGCDESYGVNDEYDDDLMHNCLGNYDIMKVYSLPIGYVMYEDIYDLEYRDLIWKRKELTLEEAKEIFDKIIQSLINDVNGIIDDHLVMIESDREDYELVRYHIASMKGWFDTIEQLKKLKLDKKGFDFLSNYYVERGFDKEELEIFIEIL